jgi:hypothetical protein
VICANVIVLCYSRYERQNRGNQLPTREDEKWAADAKQASSVGFIGFFNGAGSRT